MNQDRTEGTRAGIGTMTARQRYLDHGVSDLSTWKTHAKDLRKTGLEDGKQRVLQARQFAPKGEYP